MKLQRGTFKCFAGRGAFGRVVRRERDFQVNVMVGDRADAATVDAAFDAARSIAPVRAVKDGAPALNEAAAATRPPITSDGRG